MKVDTEKFRSDIDEALSNILAAFDDTPGASEFRIKMGVLQNTLDAIPDGASEEQRANIEASRQQAKRDALKVLFPELFKDETAPEDQVASGGAGDEQARFSDEQLAAFEEFQDEMADIQEKAQEQRLSAETAYQKSLTDLTNRFQLQRLRETQDEARRRALAVQDLNQNVIDLQGKQQDDEIKREEDFQRKRRRRLTDLARSLLEAAARLDATAVINLLARNRDTASTEKDDFDRERDERRQQTDKRIDEMRKSFVEEEQVRAEDRRINLERQLEDHQLQLELLARNRDERLRKIDEAAAKETAKLQMVFINTYNQLAKDAGQHQSNMINIQRKGHAILEAELGQWLARQQMKFANVPTAVQPSVTRSVARVPTLARAGQRTFSFATGGEMPQTGMAQLERGEQVLTAATSRMVRNAIGGAITASGLQSALAGGNGGATLNGDVNVMLGDIGQLSPEEIAMIARREFINALDELDKA